MALIPILLSLLFGAVFVLVGRWLYKNPTKMFRFGLLNPEHPGVQGLARVYATFFIFGGTFASLGVISAILFQDIPAIPLVALPLAAVGAWFLRPKTTQTDPAITPIQNAEKPKFLTKHWKGYLAFFAGLMCCLMIVLLVGLGSSDACKLAFAKAQASPVVNQRLGSPVERGLLISGNIQVSGPSGSADIAIPVRGPKGKATVYAVAQKSGGIWKLETLEIAFDETSPRLNLLNEEHNSINP